MEELQRKSFISMLIEIFKKEVSQMNRMEILLQQKSKIEEQIILSEKQVIEHRAGFRSIAQLYENITGEILTPMDIAKLIRDGQDTESVNTDLSK